MKKIFILGLIAGIIWGAVGCTKAEPDWNTFDYTVSKNDTLWDIAVEFCPDGMSVEKYMYELKECNNLENSMLYEGDTIRILTEEKCLVDMYDIVDIVEDNGCVNIILEDGNYYTWTRWAE